MQNHGLGKGVLYEARVIEVRTESTQPARGSGGAVTRNEYRVHYQGWNKKWDEWLEPEEVLRDTPDNRQLQEKSKPGGGGTAGGGATGGAPKGSHKAKTAPPPPPPSLPPPQPDGGDPSGPAETHRAKRPKVESSGARGAGGSGGGGGAGGAGGVAGAGGGSLGPELKKRGGGVGAARDAAKVAARAAVKAGKAAEDARGAAGATDGGGPRADGGEPKHAISNATATATATASVPSTDDLRLHVNLSTALKRELITGWERITRDDKLVLLPRATTVADTLGRYEADARTRARTPEQGGALGASLLPRSQSNVNVFGKPP